MKRKLTKREALIGGLSLAATIALCVAAIHYRGYLSQIEHYGYLGCFIVSIVAGGAIFVPIPGIIVVFTLGGVLNPAMIGAVAGLGESIGAVTGYLIGHGGRGFMQNRDNVLYTRFTNILNRHGSKTVFLMASFFNPVFYPFAVFLGMLRFGLLRFFLMTWAGRTIKGMLLAYAGYFGLRSILQWLGLSF